MGKNKPPDNPPKLGAEPLGEKEAERVALPKELPILPVRGLVVTSNEPPRAAAAALARRPSSAAARGENRNGQVSPPTSKPIQGRGSAANRSHQVSSVCASGLVGH